MKVILQKFSYTTQKLDLFLCRQVEPILEKISKKCSTTSEKMAQVDSEVHKDFLRAEALPKEFYFKKYADITSFSSYFYQINSVISVNPRTLLEVGIGNSIVSNYLKQSGFNLTTFDINKSLEPDVVGGIKSLPFKDDAFDTVLACEILEHIPFADVPISLSELRRVSRKKVIISIPYSCFYTENVFNIKTPFFSKQLRFVLSVPFFTSKFKRTGEHYWEMGRKIIQRRKSENS